jgi:ABC-type glycerol-3-phosphate transport system substrate-binding protein
VNDADDLQEQHFYVEVIPLPSLPPGYVHANHFNFVDDIIYFVAQSIDSEAPFPHNVIFTMSINEQTLSKLQNYTMLTPPPNALGGSTSICALFTAKDGSIWIIEVGNYFTLEETNNIDVDSDVNSNYEIYNIDPIYTLRKLDNTGVELISYDINELAARHEFFNITSFIVDDDDNIYICAGANNNSGATIYLLDTNGNMSFSLTTPNRINRFIKLGSGEIAFRSEHNTSSVLQVIDVMNQTLGERIDIPIGANNVFSGNDTFSYFFTNEQGLYGVDSINSDIKKIFNYSDNNISPYGIDQITFISDGGIIITNISETVGFNEQNVLFTVLRVAENDANNTDNANIPTPNKVEMTLGTLQLNPELENAVRVFNNTSSTHYIQIINYSSFVNQNDRTGALARLNTDIIAGRIPDILFLINMPFENYVNKELLIDLYPFLDNDLEINRNDMMESFLTALETENRLYRIAASFNISTILGNPLLLGSNPGWTIDELINVLDENPQAITPFGPYLDRLSFLALVFYHNIDAYIDRYLNVANFESDGFIKLLELANTFPVEANWNISYEEHLEMIATGVQIMEALQFGQIELVQSKQMYFGGDLIFKGWPTPNRDGNKFSILNSIAITTNATDKDGAWEFVKTFLHEDFQRDNIQWSFPINRTIFEERLEEALTIESGVTNDVLSLDLANQLMDLINSITGITGHGVSEEVWNIVSEGATDYFNGLRTAEDVARIIQSRISIFLAEQNW